MSMNPFDEIAVEEAIRLKEKGVATEIVAVSIGPAKAQETLRTALAMGADRAILIQTDDEVEPLARRQAARQGRRGGAARPGHPRQAGDRRRFATRPARCSPPCSAGRRAPSPPRSRSPATSVDVTREVDGGLETVKLKLPAIVTTDLRLNEPRYASLPNIMKAKSKPLAQKTPADYGVDTAPRLHDAEGRRAGQAPGRDQGRLGRRADRQAEGTGSGGMKTLVLVEHEGGQVKDATLAAVTAASQAGRGPSARRRPGRRRRRRGGREDRRRRQGPCRRRCGLWPQPRRECRAARRRPDGATTTPSSRPATTTGKNIAPRVAALLDVMQISDILSVEGDDTFTRPIYAGNAIATVKSSDAKKVITVRGTAFEKAAREGGSARVEAVAGTRRQGPLQLRRRRARQVRAARADQRQDHRLGRPRASARRSSSTRCSIRSPTSSARRSAPAAPRSTRAMRPTTIRSARPARSSRPKSISRSAFPARSSISPA